ncbi:maleylpyruvate isomerase N-terminal domain-containing protein [Candidatus Poriferisocius sp.]|uniref:maleylpyruvate isomerase N-terminal domain-containing protein n=1 Tax=Candidatus Poriferisocius sp. TaxID=3101276 RepID=UPI003B025EB1
MSGDASGEGPAAQYFAIRGRLVEAVTDLDDEQLKTTVPACPDWTIQQLLTHVVSMPLSIIAGDLPEGPEAATWIDRLIVRHGQRSIQDLTGWWCSNDEALSGLLANAALLVDDLFIHEGDLYGALGSTAQKDAPELASQLATSVSALSSHLATAGLAPLCVDTGEVRLVSGDGEPGWTLRADAWEAHRALSSRRTRQELIALAGDGDPRPYVSAIDAHLPLPATSLGES